MGAEGNGGAPPQVLDDVTVARLLPERPSRAHKGTFGRVVVVAGSLDYAGAALLVAGAAARTGAGLVTLAVAGSLQPVVAGRILEVTTRGLPETSPGVLDPARSAVALAALSCEAMVVGPGLREGPETDELVARLLADPGREGTTGGPAGAPVVLDAEALNGLARRAGWWSEVQRRVVLTPHPGEFRRLCGNDAVLDGSGSPASDAERATAAVAASRRWDQVVVLKGARTVIASPDAVAVAPFENPALATAGSGDVLSGAIGALLAQGLSPWDAACLGVYLHGMAGAAAREALGDAGVVAPDLLLQLPLSWRRLSAIRGARGRLGFAASGERIS